MDSETVYVVRRVIDGELFPIPDLMTGIVFDPLVHEGYPPLTTLLIRGVVPRFEIRDMTFPVGDLVWDEGELGCEYVDAQSSVGKSTLSYIRFVPLTSENFSIFKGHMLGWDELAARFTTTRELQWIFHQLMVE